MRYIVLTLLFSFSFSAYSDEALQKMIELSSKGIYEHSNEWLCTSKISRVCSSTSCNENSSKVWFRLNFQDKVYSRCNENGCDEYEMTYIKGGMYTIIELNGRASYLKVTNDGSDFVDSATSGTAAFLNFGSCKRLN